MIGAIAGAVADIGSAIFGGISSAKAQRLKEKYLANQEAEAKRWYDAESNTTAVDRADAQAGATRLYEAIKERARNRRGTQAVMGGTEESVRAAEADDAKALGDYYSNVTAQGEVMKDKARQEYRTRKAQLDAQRIGLEAERQKAIADGVSGVANAAASVAGALEGIKLGSKTPSGVKQGASSTTPLKEGESVLNVFNNEYTGLKRDNETYTA